MLKLNCNFFTSEVNLHWLCQPCSVVPVVDCPRVSLSSQTTAAASVHMMMFDSEMIDDAQTACIELPSCNTIIADEDTSEDSSDDDSSDDTSDDDSPEDTSEDDSPEDTSGDDRSDEQSTENGTLLASINPEHVSYDVPEPMDESSIQDEVPDASVHLDESTANI